jgi:hypothetical protein
MDVCEQRMGIILGLNGLKETEIGPELTIQLWYVVYK